MYAISKLADVPSRCSRRLLPATALALYTYVFSFAFDFKGPDGGTIAQSIYLALALASGAFLILQHRPRTCASVRWRALKYLIAFIVTTPISFLAASLLGFSDASWDYYLRLLVPYLLLLTSMLVARSLFLAGYDLSQLLTPIIVACLTSFVWRFFYAQHVQQIEMADVRYQVLSGGMGCALAYGIQGVFLSAKPKLAHFVILGVCFICVGVSITRGMLSAIAVMLLAGYSAHLTYVRSIRLPIVARRVAAFCVLACCAVAAFATMLAIRPNVQQTWHNRFVELWDTGVVGGSSGMSRPAQASGMLKAAFSSPFAIVVGHGIGATYTDDPAYFGVLARSSRSSGPYRLRTYRSPADIGLPYYLFSSGLLFGSLFYAFLVVLTIDMWRATRTQTPCGSSTSDGLCYWPFLCMVFVWTQELSAYVFLERFGPLLLGLACGVGYSMLSRSAMVQAQALPPVPSGRTRSLGAKA